MKTPLILLAVFAVLYVSESDYQQELSDAAFYCEQVKSGAWPNFEGVDCE